jgi:hypothetical protein
VAITDDAEYERLLVKKATMPATKFGDAYEPAHLESIEKLSQKNMELSSE